MIGLLRAREVSFGYQEGTDVIDRFDLDVRCGEAVAVTGENGAGKSTLLRCLADLELPGSGSVTWCGESMGSASEGVRRAVSFLVDEPQFFSGTTVAEHLHLFATAHGVAGPYGTVRELVDELDIGDVRTTCVPRCPADNVAG